MEEQGAGKGVLGHVHRQGGVQFGKLSLIWWQHKVKEELLRDKAGEVGRVQIVTGFIGFCVRPGALVLRVAGGH